MPRDVRNFWLTAKIDGRASPVRVGGPTGADGQFCLTIKVRNRGKVYGETVEIRGRCSLDGTLRVVAYDLQGDGHVLSKTHR